MTLFRSSDSGQPGVPATRVTTWKMVLRIVLATTTLLPSLARADGPTPEIVRIAIDRGVRYLLRSQDRDGSWSGASDAMTTQPGGVTALCTLALLNCGRAANEPPIRKALNYLRNTDPESQTYATSLQIMVLAAAEPDKEVRLRQLANHLEFTQRKEGPGKGGWGYGKPAGYDHSNSQFALLALREAESAGVEVKPSTWRLALDYWKRHQQSDGSWIYDDRYGPTGSMACAGVASLVIASGQLASGDATIDGDQVTCCGQQEDTDEIMRGMQWLTERFTVQSNPGGESWYYYYMYGLERVGRLTGQRFIGSHDWYREGVEALLRQQDPTTGQWIGRGIEQDSTIATSLALLFLSKGRRPVLISKLQRAPDDDWNRHRHDILHLTRHVEGRWNQALTWQTIDGKRASVDDLLQTPVLYISGRDNLALTESQKNGLRSYLTSGGFLLADACCGGQGFDRDFRELMRELFPESRLRFLEPSHPIWFAEQPVPEAHIKPLYGLDTCCRTSVIYSPEDLSCDWELANPRVGRDYPAAVKARVRASLIMGSNILAYATNRQLRDKLDVVQHVPQRSSIDNPSALRIGKLQHGGGSNDAPVALSNLLSHLAKVTNLPVDIATPIYSSTDPAIHELPILFLHGRRNFQWTNPQRDAIREFLERGGFLLADSICGSAEFARSLRTELARILPEQPMRPIPSDHPIFTAAFRGYTIRNVAVRRPVQRVNATESLRVRQVDEPPTLEGITLDGRLIVVFSPLDISCALENHPSLECLGYERDDAVRIGVNAILYAMQN